ncbi:MAG: hypothetical protein F6K50_24375 [Moorea sp. SIO3I7]|uniref:hypothetical protein n=1 Tax=unclassified Moorena TaxID=2683338 RepID=UPI0013CA8BD2|nr:MULTISPECIES: hypothetical protein [unclassified Moorena]NEN98533.1 hypothetical protein [Moorena sp. SIO3I7]NEO20214.1 hypothetical protein [Moorena sp. SIO4A5]NEP22661.1 hypothetical protein [Moorena sp. SIO3I6]
MGRFLLRVIMRTSYYSLQPWPIGHASRTTFNRLTLAYWPRFANNLQPSNLGLLATLREQPSTV